MKSKAYEYKEQQAENLKKKGNELAEQAKAKADSMLTEEQRKQIARVKAFSEDPKKAARDEIEAMLTEDQKLQL